MSGQQRRGLLVPAFLLFAFFAAAQAWLPTGRTRSAHAAADPDDIHRALGLLQYVRADYAQAVAEDGAILDADEYAEQKEFLARARTLVAAQTHRGAGFGTAAALPDRLRHLEELVARRAAPKAVSTAVNALQGDLIDAYRLQLWPLRRPDLRLGARTWSQACAACHGVDGGGGTPVGSRLEPPPPDLLDAERDATLSPYQVFNRVTYGVPGADMPAFETLTPKERWDVAFYVLALRRGIRAARTACAANPPRRSDSASPSLQDLARLTDSELERLPAAAGVSHECRADLVALWRAEPNHRR